MNKLYLFVVVLSLLSAVGYARVVKGSVNTHAQLTEVAQFTFSVNDNKNPSQLDNTINIEATAATFQKDHTYWVLYYDDKASWRNVTKHKMSCDRMRSAASYSHPVSLETELSIPVEDYVRPHIWYVALLNCPNPSTNKTEALKVSYNVHFINTHGSEFGFDEEGMLALNSVYFVFFLILTGIEVLTLMFLHHNGSSHVIVYILTCIVAVITFSLFFVMCHWATYRTNGIGSDAIRGIGQFLMGISNIAFSMLLVCIASGWSITYYELPQKNVVISIGGIYLITYIILFIACVATGRSAASTQFVYATGATLAFVIIYILLCWLGVWAYFAWSLYNTWHEESQYEKRLFYLIFGIGYSVWFLLPAVLNLISIAIDEWYRPRVVDAFQITTTFLGVVALIVFLWPTRMQKYFRMAQYSQATPGTTSDA